MALFFTGCVRTYNVRLQPVKQGVKRGDIPGAVSRLKKTGLKEQEKNRLLYHLEAGLLYHLAGEYSRSNYFLERAEWISDELYTRSITSEAASLAVSDNLLPYRGEFYDYLFINYYKLLNYLHLGSLENALVEVRRINHKLTLFEKEFAFLHYLTAMLYHFNGQTSSAFIEYKKAYEAYKKKVKKGIPFPLQLKKDISVFYRETKFSRCSEFPPEFLKYYKPPSDYGTVVFLVETNFVPYKYEERIDMAISQELKEKHSRKLSDVYYLSVALPEYAAPESAITSAVLNLGGQQKDMELVEDIGGRVIKHFNEEKAKIIARAIARAVTKYITYKSVKGKSDEDPLRRVLGTAVNIMGSVTERADTRSWLLLPNKIWLSRRYLKPGSYEFNIQLKPLSGSIIRTEKKTFTIKKGELKFIVLREFCQG